MYSHLVPELAGDPEVMGYAGKTPAHILSLLIVLTRKRARSDVSAVDVLEALDDGEVAVLTPKQEGWLNRLTAREIVDFTRPKNRQRLRTLFPAGSVSRQAIIALASEMVSRAEEIGISPAWLTEHRIEVALARGSSE